MAWHLGTRINRRIELGRGCLLSHRSLAFPSGTCKPSEVILTPVCATAYDNYVLSHFTCLGRVRRVCTNTASARCSRRCRSHGIGPCWSTITRRRLSRRGKRRQRSRSGRRSPRSTRASRKLTFPLDLLCSFSLRTAPVNGGYEYFPACIAQICIVVSDSRG